jgi:hypothetical protein
MTFLAGCSVITKGPRQEAIHDEQARYAALEKQLFLAKEEKRLRDAGVSKEAARIEADRQYRLTPQGKAEARR